MTLGIDYSDWQGVVDWTKAKATAQFGVCKATDGLTYFNPTFVANHDGQKAADVPFGAYHFFYFDVDPVSQAKYFLEKIDGYEGEVLPMVDVETDSPQLTLAQKIDALAAFNAEVEKTLSDKKILVYTFYSFWNDVMKGSDAFAGHPLWVAEYNDQPTPSLPFGWDTWTIWQYTSKGTVDGVEGYCDLDKLPGGFGVETILR